MFKVQDNTIYLSLLGTLFLGYFGALLSFNVLGLLKWTDVRIFLFLLSWTPRNTAFLAFRAFSFIVFVAGSAGAFGAGSKNNIKQYLK